MTTLTLKSEGIELSVRLDGLSAARVAMVSSVFLHQLLELNGVEDAAPKKNWEVILRNHGDKKIEVIKEIRSIAGIGLKEAKDTSETPDSVIRRFDIASDAIAAAAKLRSVGASVDVREAA